jgi:hypothetical protein
MTSSSSTSSPASCSISPSATSRWARRRPTPRAALNRPQPLPELPAGRQQQPVALAVGAEPARHHRLLGLIEHLDRRGPLVRVHPDHDPAHKHTPPSPSSRTCDRRRRAALSRAGQTPLEPLLVTVPGETHARVEPHQPAVGSRCESPCRTHLDPSLARPEPSVESEIADERAPVRRRGLGTEPVVSACRVPGPPRGGEQRPGPGPSAVRRCPTPSCSGWRALAAGSRPGRLRPRPLWTGSGWTRTGRRRCRRRS